MHPNHNNRPPPTPGPYYGTQEEYDAALAAQAAYPTPPNGPYQTPAGPNPYYPGITQPSPSREPVSVSAAGSYAYPQPYQYSSPPTFGAAPPGPGAHYAASASGAGVGAYAPVPTPYATTTAGGSSRSSAVVGGGYTYASPLTSPSASHHPPGGGGAYFPPADSQTTYTSPGGTVHTLAENEALLKRLRNTAASARFRAKKKQRERSLEERERDKREELERLEGRIRELELENRFLKGLVWAPRDGKEVGKEEAKSSDSERSESSTGKARETRSSPKGKGKERAK